MKNAFLNLFFKFGIVLPKDLDQTCGFYNWDGNLISTDKLRQWINDEKGKVHQATKTATGDENSDSDRFVKKRVDPGAHPLNERKSFINLLFNLMIGIEEPFRGNYTHTPFVSSPTYKYYIDTYVKRI